MDRIGKVTVSFIALFVALAPFWLYLLARMAFDPQGFWQNIVLFGIGIWILGGLQIFLLIFLIWFLAQLWE